MKKTLLAAAVLAGFAGAAQAETSVTLYGIVDVGVGYQQVKGGGLEKASRTGLIDGTQSGSRWGLRGSEDLGDGLRAIFTLESGFNSRTGRSGQGGRLFGRQATLGLASDNWGTLTVGRQTNVSSDFFGPIDPFAASYGQSHIGSSFGQTATLRYDNAVKYLTPSFGGFQVGALYSFDIADGDTSEFQTNRKDRAINAGVRYVNGPLNVAASYDRINGNSALARGSDRINAWLVGGTYDFEVVKLALAYGQSKDGWIGSAAPSLQGGYTIDGTGFNSNVYNDGLKVKSYLVGLSAPVGPGSLFGSWQRADPNESVSNGAGTADATQNVYSLGYTYDLSKRTNVYAYGSYAKNYAFLDDVKSTAVGVGLRHRF
ncbi:porin [Orrella dioscoreae]|uniref:Outer membrane porin n=1 Tax=Orrella dioscoreae TaxID=1851544 RepID=A0A1C3K7C7_9BURK|nr:porin [Orrella dioscoreae]SBT27441.1 outer membrane porin [Orrella dioscoreae]SOE48269.1 outer membrane porin [Orrella dioscoreae]